MSTQSSRHQPRPNHGLASSAKQKQVNRPAPGNGPGRYRWVVFSTLAVAYLFVYFHRLSPAVIAVEMMADLKVGATAMGALAAAYFYAYAVMQIPVGMLSDSWGPRRSITLFFGLAAVGSIVFGLADSLLWAIVGRTLVGLGVAMVFVATLKILTSWFSATEFAKMTGLIMAVGGIGVYTSSDPLVFLSDLLGWRGCFLAIGALSMLLTGCIWFFVRNTPEEMGLPSVSSLRIEPKEQSIRELWQGVVQVCKTPAFWPLAIWNLLTNGIFFSFGGLWGGPYLQQVYGLSKSQVGGILSMIALGLILGAPALSYLSDKVLDSRKKVLIGASSINVFLMFLLTFFIDSLPVWVFYLWFVIFGCSAASIAVMCVTTVKELFPLHLAGTATGVVNVFPFLGASLLQPLVGWVLEWRSGAAQAFTTEAYGSAFLIYLAGFAIALVSICLARDTHPQSYNV
ncbi:MFS transporter [Dethiosulfatarculus sandiegensis]|uniref:MFS transporter n=1 Tax=Dethiosulfatarculus sandiegensis TaxID=1429043 RepID=A0A0D2HQL0_9BACT|nr:MFS transporter [Dethiosulfatarculus sandiegensis]KIX12763.1 MFS transporter [Dethiosulfatarculus sandiegensis]